MNWVSELERLLPGRVASDGAARSDVAGDLSPLRQMRQLRGEPMPLPDAVVRPRATEDVQQVMRFANAHEIVVIPRGGGSGVVEAVDAAPGSIVLDLRSMDRIGPIDVASGIVEVEAGCIGATLERALATQGMTLGHYPQSIALATIGGLVATRSSGQYSTRYGNIEDILLALEVVTVSGDVLRLGHPPRRSLGPEVLPLFVGSEGTLGVITRVTLAAQALPEAERLAAYGFRGVAEGIEVMRRLARAGLPIGLLRLYDAADAARSFGGVLGEPVPEALLLTSTLGPREVAEAGALAAERIALAAGGDALGAPVAEHWLRTRNDVSEWAQYLEAGVVVDTIECAAPWTRLPAAYSAAISAVRALPEVAAVFAHVAHAGSTGASLYFTFGAVPGEAQQAPSVHRQVWGTLLKAVRGEGATVSHHHGVGRVRRPWAWQERAAERPLLAAVRERLDPLHLLNRGALWEDE